MNNVVFGKPKEEKQKRTRKINNYDFEQEDKIINKFNQLYIGMRQIFLIMNKDGNYIRKTFGKNSDVHLNDDLLRQHLRGNKTIGIFSGNHLTKCLIFDLDMPDKQLVKWVAYKIRSVLISFGFPQDKIYISYSGNKGYHVSAHFEEMVQYKTVEEIYKATLYEGEIIHLKDQIELRPQPGLGVKLPLGRNFNNPDKNKNTCYFCDYDNELKIIKDRSYILNIQPLTVGEYENILERMKDDEYIYKSKIIDVDINNKNDLDTLYKEPDSFKENIDENETVETIQNILINGLTMPGTRNNSVLKIAKLFNYYGLSLDDCIINLKEWMEWQDTKYYKTPLDKCNKEIERISKYVYEKNISLTVPNKQIVIYKSEIEEIMKIQLNTHKLVLYSLIIHSKRYANHSGVFYMAYSQLEKSTNISTRTLIKVIGILEENEYIEVISRNMKVKGTYKKLPNKYRIKIKLGNQDNDKTECNVIDSSFNQNQENEFLNVVCSFFSNDELKVMCNRRQYEQFKSHRLVSAV